MKGQDHLRHLFLSRRRVPPAHDERLTLMTRIPVPDDVAATVLFLSDHTCCKCRERGRPVQLHHIDGDNSNSTEDNLVPLCLICHNETMVSGGFGRHLNESAVRKYRSDWLERVRARRDRADELAVQVMGPALAPPLEGATDQSWKPAGHPGVPIDEYVQLLPRLRERAYAERQPRLDTGITSEMVNATHDVISVMEDVLATLAMYYPEGHFKGANPRPYITQVLQSRFEWHRLHIETYGVGRNGTIVSTMAASAVLADIEAMIGDVVSSLLLRDRGDRAPDAFSKWHEEWRKDLTDWEGLRQTVIDIAERVPSDRIQRFVGHVAVTATGNRDFVEFLNANDGRIIFVNTTIDASVATKSQADFIAERGVDMAALGNGRLSGVELPLDVDAGRGHVGVVFKLNDDRSLIPSTGGTGVLTVQVRGFFEVAQVSGSGPRTVFHLNEHEATLSLLAEYLARGTARMSPRG